MSFYSYKNANPSSCPGLVGSDVLNGLQEKVCVQVKRVYDSCLQQEQLDDKVVTLLSYGIVASSSCQDGNVAANNIHNGCGAVSPDTPVLPIHFESCRSTSTTGVLRNVTVDRLCDRPCFARVRASVEVPIDILFSDSRCQEYIGKAVVTVNKDVLLSVPDESIVPFSLESMVSAICVAGTYIGNNQFRMTICVTVVLKVLASVEILIPSYGFCPIPPCEEFAENVCDEFFSLPLFPPMSLCNEGGVTLGTAALSGGTCGSVSCGSARSSGY
jgi:hypothetical protein